MGAGPKQSGHYNHSHNCPYWWVAVSRNTCKSQHTCMQVARTKYQARDIEVKPQSKDGHALFFYGYAAIGCSKQLNNLQRQVRCRTVVWRLLFPNPPQILHKEPNSAAKGMLLMCSLTFGNEEIRQLKRSLCGHPMAVLPALAYHVHTLYMQQLVGTTLLQQWFPITSP